MIWGNYHFHSFLLAFISVIFCDSRHDDDEFVSDSYQASTSDLAEADETMKKLGVAEDDLEAELEGELNEYEVVDGKGQDGENPDWENQIQEMLEAESSDLK